MFRRLAAELCCTFYLLSLVSLIFTEKLFADLSSGAGNLVITMRFPLRDPHYIEAHRLSYKLAMRKSQYVLLDNCDNIDVFSSLKLKNGKSYSYDDLQSNKIDILNEAALNSCH